ncbi:MAG: hypothetical protein ABIU54_03815 [Candidatus Eisenbacteria bacterium]
MTVARTFAIAAFTALALPAVVHALSFQPIRHTRAQMESALGEAPRWRFVYGTRVATAEPLLRQRALMLARRLFGGDSTQVEADRDLTEAELAANSVMLLGSPRENLWTGRLAPALPVRFTERGFEWQGHSYERPGDVLHLSYPNPLAPRRFVLLIAGNSVQAMVRRGGFMFGGEDYRIVREGELARSGTFAQASTAPWRYDAALDRDREAERSHYAAGLRAQGGASLQVRAPAGMAMAAQVASAGIALLSRMDRAGLAAPARASPITLTLYRSLEAKGVLTRDTRPEHLEGNDAHAAPQNGHAGLDLWSIAAARLGQLGGRQQSRFLEPAGVWCAARFEGESLDRSLARLYSGRLLPTASEAASRPSRWRSPLVWTPARALLMRSVWETAAPSQRRPALSQLLRADPPGTLDSLCRFVQLDPRRVGARYQRLADSLARHGQQALALQGPRPWRLADGFQRGVCLAHSVSLEHGYLSAECGRELTGLQRMGANWVSITPFGYVPSLNTPEIFPSSSGGPDEESDEAVAECAARARANGQRVWLKPHLWTRGWVGDLAFTPQGWEQFFDRYREFILHWALLAEREGMDGLFVGHELVSSTRAHPQKWRALIADVRRVYKGSISYGANWDEVQRIDFWDAVDLVGVSFYFPLAERPTREPAVLRVGARKALATLKPIAARTGRPVLLAEVGYAPMAAAAVRPWEEGEGPPDLETQRACYAAVIDAMEPEDWIAGAFWWKWFTSSSIGGPADASFTPRGKPAQQVLERALQDWQGRPVRVPAAGSR